MHKNLRRSFDLLLIIAVLVTSLGGNFSEAKAASTIFINEIHYDNTGGDVGEAVEIAGPAGTDLTGWSIVLYNGSNGAVYDTDSLSGTIPDQDNGYGTISLSYPSNGLQNGAPDGIALVDNTSTVVQFLSYEGSFTAVGGAANGMTSTDIGVLEDGSEPVGQSLQMTGGPGMSDSDFTWASVGTATFGAVNTGQSFGTPPPIVINEFQADPDAANGDANGDGTVNTSQDEFVEIVNTSGADLDVSGWTVSDAVDVRHTFPTNTVIPADCNIVVFAGGTPTGTFGNAVVQTASAGFLGLNNTGDTIIVNDGSTDVATYVYGSEGGNNQSLTLDPDITGAAFVEHSTATGSGGALFSPGTKIDGTNFSGCTSSDTTPPTVQTLSPADDSTGVAVSTNLVISFDENVQKGTGNIAIHLVSDDSVVQTIDVTDAAVTVSGADVTIDPPSDLAVSTAYYVNIPAGAIEDTSANDFAGITDATTWSFTTAATGPSILTSLVFNEVLPDPNSTTRNFDTDGDGTAETADEFLEIYNTSATALDISGLEFWDEDSDNYFTVPASTTLGANGFVVVVSDVAGGSLPAVNAGSHAFSAGGGLSLSNTSDNLVLYDPASDQFIQAIYNGDTVDTPASPPAGDYVGFSATATLLGSVQDFGSDTDGTSRALSPDGLTSNPVDHDTIASGGVLATPGNSNTAPSILTVLVFNEVLPDPNSATRNFDTDGDGTAETADEFLEIYNTSATALDISGLEFWDEDSDNYYTVPASTTLGANGFVVVVSDVAGGSLPAVNAGSHAFSAGGGLSLSNTADNLVVYDPASDQFIQAIYNGDTVDTPASPPAGDYVGFSATATVLGSVQDFGSDTDGTSRALSPDGLTSNPVDHDTIGSGGTLATPGDSNVAAAAIDLEFIKTVDDNNPDEGDTITYTLTVSNVSSTQAASTIVVRDYLPDTTTQVDNVTPGTCSQGTISSIAANTLEWTVGDLAVSASATCTISVDVRTGTDGYPFTNNAEVWSVTETTDGDSTPGNMGASPAEDDEASAVVNVGLPAACGTLATPISTIQGSGALSPEDGNVHTIEGVVVGDFQTSASLSGFFLQEEPTDEDGNPATSEGIFVFDGAAPALDVNVGDVVRVTGTVDEYYDLTELTSVSSVLLCSAGFYAPTAITLPVASMDVWEQHEGMLVTIPQTLVATGNYTWGRYGEVELSVGTRLSIPTNVVAPGPAAVAMLDLNNRSRIQLEDGRTAQNPLPVPYLGTGNTLREGDTIPSLTGVVNYGYGVYEIHPVAPVTFTRVNARQATPPAVGGTLKVAGTNVLNYFVTLDTGSPVCGPAGGMDCRGANTASEFTRQRNKIIAAIIAMDADVVGLMEMENHSTDAALTDLVNGLNATAGAGTYAAISTGTIGTDAIKVALIYKPATITPLGAFDILDSSFDPTFIDDKNRPTLAQTFVEIASGERFTVAVNHLKSKGSDCNSIGDPDTGDGQGNCNITRTNAATALVNWLATDPTGSGDPDFLIIGDLNSYAMEDPITAITSSGYTNLISSFVGAGAYSYEFNGETGYLDHALATTSLAGQVTGVAEWHINADEPPALDYNDFNQAILYQPDAYRASDHDPVMIGLAMGAPPVVLFGAKTVPADGASLTTGPTQIFVEFSKNVLNDGSSDAANNTDNYMLLEAMGDGFQTTSCAAGASTADLSVPINSATYSNASGFIATLNINNGIPLPAGTYQLFVCGTTSITDLSGLELNGGLSDTVVNFTVGAVSELPATGFPQGMVTPLAEKPQDMPYTETVMMLEIPSLGVSTPIVGVPISDNGWDITWLGRNAGYLAGTAFPTWNGNTVITGHVWDANNQPGPFANVKSLAYGDTIQIQAWGLTYTYQVRETKLVRPWQINTVLKEETYDWVTLVTCEDYNDSSQKYGTRRVIRAVLVDVR